MSLSLFSQSFFIKGEFKVTGIFLGIKIPMNLTTDCFFKERENKFVMCCQTLGLTSFVFIFYNPMIFLSNQLYN
jgi:hypothetical protein